MSAYGIPRGIEVGFPRVEDATGYVLRWTSGGDAVASQPCESPPCRIDGLTPGIDYSITVATRDRTGESDRSAPLVARPLAGDEILLRRAWETEAGSIGAIPSSAGDLDGDGDAELVIAEPFFGVSGEGRLRIHEGDRSGLADTADVEIVGPAESALGGSIAPAGDVNEDGFADLVVGSPGTASDNAGRVLLFRGGLAGLPASAAWTGSTLQPGSRSGAAVAGGDVNADGLADVVATATAFVSSGIVAAFGRVDLFPGAGPASGAIYPPAVSVIGPPMDVDFGRTVALADVDGDGFDDLVVGAPLADDPDLPVPVLDRGEVHVFLWNDGAGGFDPATVLPGDGDEAFLGLSLSRAGDTDGDGREEVILGAPGYRKPEGFGLLLNAGAAYLHEGTPSGLSPTPAWTLLGEGTAAELGTSVTGAGDLNGDGFDDIAVGEPGAGVTGAVHVWFGSPSGLTRSLTFEGRSAGEGFGVVVRPAGDVNGDGFPDLVASSREGRIEVIHGGRPLSSPRVDAGWLLQGSAGMAVRASAATFFDDVSEAGYTCTWLWGDGTSDVIGDCRPGEVPAEHVYAEPGAFDVVLRVLSTDSRLGEAVTAAVIR